MSSYGIASLFSLSGVASAVKLLSAMLTSTYGYILGSIDAGDAYLITEQDEATVVEVDGKRYELGYTLPRQRVGSVFAKKSDFEKLVKCMKDAGVEDQGRRTWHIDSGSMNFLKRGFRCMGDGSVEIAMNNEFQVHRMISRSSTTWRRIHEESTATNQTEEEKWRKSPDSRGPRYPFVPSSRTHLLCHPASSEVFRSSCKRLCCCGCWRCVTRSSVALLMHRPVASCLVNPCPRFVDVGPAGHPDAGGDCAAP